MEPNDRFRHNDHFEFVIRMKLRAMLPIDESWTQSMAKTTIQTRDGTAQHHIGDVQHHITEHELDVVTYKILTLRNQELVQALDSNNILWKNVQQAYIEATQEQCEVHA